MKLWLIERNDTVGYDEYEGAVVRSETEIDAQRMHPDGLPWPEWEGAEHRVWAASAGLVTATCLGSSDDDRPGVVLAAFNAG